MDSRINSTIEILINGKPVHVREGSTILQACGEQGIEIPRFCYHERLSVAGNCRMCLVQIENAPKPVASCATIISKGMSVHTDTELVRKARENVLELLLANHPLDCPICDQGGECDLQDQAMIFGSDRGRFSEQKRSVPDKELGPLIKTVMTRCIHCTRCVRFVRDVAGVDILGTLGRGQTMEIGTYVEAMMSSPLSGNLIDLCPVGALTSKPYSFLARPWELTSVDSVDVSDSLGSNIRIDSRGTEIMRILPRVNESINEEWLTDKARFAFDGLKYQRLDSPLLKESDGVFKTVSWETAIAHIVSKLKNVRGNNIWGVCGPLAESESIVALKDWLNALGSSNLEWDSSLSFNCDFRNDYSLGVTLSELENVDVCLLVGTNPRRDIPLLWTRLRKGVLNHGMSIGSVGQIDSVAEVFEFGTSFAVLEQICHGHHWFSEKLASAQKPAVIVGDSVLQTVQPYALFSQFVTLSKRLRSKAPNWKWLNLLHQHASSVALCDLGFRPGVNAKSMAQGIQGARMIYLLGADRRKIKRQEGDFIIYQGHHGDFGAQQADVILPGRAYTEKNSLYVNAEGRVQMTQIAVPAPVDSREDWQIIAALAHRSGHALQYVNSAGIRARLAEIAPSFGCLDKIEESLGSHIESQFLEAVVFGAQSINPSSDGSSYQDNVIAGNSPTMAKCAKSFGY